MSTYLLDTHYLIWSITDTKKISKKLKDILTDPKNRVVVSVINFWEISLKFSLGKLELNGFAPEDLPELCERMNFEVIALSTEESSSDTNARQYSSRGLRMYMER